MKESVLHEALVRSPELTVPQALRELLEKRIIAGEIQSGGHINENALAASLGVNRAAMREALTALAEAGLVEFIRNRGAFVRAVGLEDALHLYDVRAGLARSAGRLLALRATPSELRQLEAMHEELCRLSEAEDVEGYDRLNIDFHTYLIECARNPHLLRLEDKVSRDIRLYLREGITTRQTLRISSKEHGEILQAVRGSDAELAGRAFELHVINGKQRMLENASLRGIGTAGFNGSR